MRRSVLASLVFASVLSLSACAGRETLSAFPIAGGPLRADEIAFSSFSGVALHAASFDVVNQDASAPRNTGLAGKVDPMPADILSRYAAGKFRAVGGGYTTRLSIRQAQIQVRSVKEEGGWMTGPTVKAEMVATVTATLSATRPDGNVTSVTANTTQASQLSAETSPEARREAYMDVMNRVLKALDDEFGKQLPVYFDEVVAR